MNIQNVMNLYSAFRQNPISMLQRRFNVPSNLNTPDQIISHLVQTGQVSQEQINQMMQMGKFFGK